MSQTDKKNKNELVLLPLGGAGEIGMNLYLYGYGPRDNRQWLMVDVGVTFPGPGEPGIELIFPDISFIEEDRHNLAGIVLTHGHEDHLGALIDLWPRLRAPVYATPFTAALLAGKIAGYGSREDFEVTELPLGSRFDVGPFDLEFVSMSHSIPESNALIIRTLEGRICHTGDWKLDKEPVVGEQTNEKRLREIGDEGIDVLVCDSTNIFKKGHSGSEGEVARTLERVIKEAENRVIVTAFSSNVARIKAVALAAKATGRYVVVAGRSLWRIITAARETGYLPEELNFLDQDQYGHLQRSEMVLLCTGSQGENRAALARIAANAHHKIKFAPKDLVIFSSFTIPGNERSVGQLLNNLADNDIDIMTLADELVHASGHPQQGELKQLYDWIRPGAVVPMHGEYRFMREHRKFALENGIARSAIVTNGEVMKLLPVDNGSGDWLEKIDEAPCGRWYLDGRTVSIHHEEPMRERRKLAYVGLVSTSVTLSSENSRLLEMDTQVQGIPKEIDEYEDLEDLVETVIENTLKSLPKSKRRDHGLSQEALRRAVRAEIFRLWGKKPVVIVHLAYV